MAPVPRMDGAPRKRAISMNEPTYFVTTGFPKSGNSWLEAMLFELDGVGGYSTDASRGLPVTVQILSRCKPLREFLDARGVSFEAFFTRLLDPERAPAVVFDETDLPALES